MSLLPPRRRPARGRESATPDRPPRQGLVRRFPRNAVGRDLVVGDIHGCYDQVLDALRAVGFDRDRDRLFSIGDTVDRGPDSPRAEKFLSLPWVHAVRGNHEDEFLEMYDVYKGAVPDEEVLRFWTSRNGMRWWQDYPHDAREALIGRFRRLPVVIEIETARGLVGLVHAQVPRGMDWSTFTAMVASGDRKTIREAVWGRDRIDGADDSGVQGIDRVFVGHTILGAPRRMGNVYYIDTGAVSGILNDDPARGRLTMADVSARTAVFARDPVSGSFVDVRDDDEPGENPFGRYAR